MSEPEVILTHESDLDGLVAGLLLVRLARKLHGAKIELQAWNYQGWRNRQMAEPVAWVADFSFDARIDRPGWVVIDHHVHTVQPRQATLIHNVKKSAALLAYDLCRDAGLATPALDRLVNLTNIGDLWLSSDPDFDLALDYASLVKEYGFWNLHKLVDGDPERLVDHPLLEVMAAKRLVENPIGYAWCAKHVEEITPELGIVSTAVGDTNLIVHQLLDRGATPYKVLVTLFPKSNRTVVASFRSLQGEALPIAVKLQGGGHPNAAGTTLPRSVTDVETAVTFLRETLAPAQAIARFNNAFAELKL